MLDIEVDAEPVIIEAVGDPGVYTFRAANVNDEDDYLYFKDSNIPEELVPGASYIYDTALGEISGISEGSLVYAEYLSDQVVTFLDLNNQRYPFVGSTDGQITLNTPIVFENTLNINIPTPSNQAVKYYTNDSPLSGIESGETYFLKNVAADFTGTTALYDFTNNSHTFTTCGQTGRVGPTEQQIIAGNLVSWSSQYLSEGNFQGYQDWTVPVSGIYRFDVQGASGYEGSGSGSSGRGARIRGDVSLTKGEVITIIAGQVGAAPTSGTAAGGSGGGSFVVRKSGSEPIFVSGGGSAGIGTTPGRDAQTTIRGGAGTSGRPGGEDGQGGPATSPQATRLTEQGRSGGGGGFASRGENAQFSISTFRNAPVFTQPGGGGFNDGLSSFPNSDFNRGGGNGGFGGGASGNAEQAQSGGGGGFSGGAGTRDPRANFVGGGGGSFVSRSASNLATSNGEYDDLNTFNNQPIENLDSYNVGEGSIKVDLVTAFTSGNTIHPTAQDAENGTNAISIAPGGNSYHALVPISYDIQNNKIHFSSPHGFTSTQAISFDLQFPTSDIRTPETSSTSAQAVYYVDVVDNFTIGIIGNPAANFFTPTEKSNNDVIRRLVVNLSLNRLNIPTHGLSVDQPIQYGSGGGNPIVPLQDGVTYYVSNVIDADNFELKVAIDAPTSIDFQEAGTGTSHSFIFLTVNFTENTLYIPSHGLISGQAVNYSTNEGEDVGGLINDTTYFVIRVDDSSIRLSTKSDLSDVVDLTSVGTGTHSLFINALNFESNTFTIPRHGFLQGELVEYDSRGQDVITGLETNQTYYVIFIDGNNIRLALSPQEAEGSISINIQETPIGVGRHSLTSLSQTPDGIYSIISVPSDDTFTVAARGQVPILTKPFNPRSTVNPELNSFFFPSHGFLTGTKVLYDVGDGLAINNLSNDTEYYVVVTNQDYFKLAESLQDAVSGVTLNTGNFGTGVSHSLTTNQLNGSIVGSGNVSVVAGSVLVDGAGTAFSKILKVGDFFTIYPPNITKTLKFLDEDVNTGNNRVEVAHNFEPGDLVRFNTGGGVAPTPLINEYYYYVGVLDETSIQLFTSYTAAIDLTAPLNLSSTGTGQNFSLTETTPVGPVVRRITAVGSDTQVTVDRPYASEFIESEYAYPTFLYVRPSGFSLHRPFDGGVEMSTGSGNWYSQIIRQTRKYFRYQSGKGIQTSFAINFKPSIDIESIERFSATQGEVKTRRPHNLISGLFVQIAEAEDSQGNPSPLYNGDFQVTVVDLLTFRIISNSPIPTGIESRAFGFPQFHVTSWSNGAVRSGMFDFQNGMFFEFDGQKIYCVRRSSTQQTAGTVSALRGSELIFGDYTKFTAQYKVGDYTVMRGQTYRIIDIESDTQLSVRPEYRGSTGLEITFDPATQVNLNENSFSVVRHGLSQRLPIVYNSIDGESLGGLINGRTYYASVINANSFKILPSPDSENEVNISSIGTTSIHSFVPAKSGIILTKTVDTKAAQEDWNIDKCDGTGPSGYNLDLSRIQMCYMDYSWYGAGKIRYGFKTDDGLVRYVHEFKHNNVLFESYFRSGNLPARYEVITFENPTYVPSLFHWGTSVIMDGTFDDDRGYLFTAGSQNLSVSGTTTKSFAGAGIDLETDRITSLTHGFRTGDQVQFQSIASDGLPGDNAQNPEVAIVGSNELEYLTNTDTYGVLANSADEIYLTPKNSLIKTFNTVDGGIRTSQSGIVVTVVSSDHGLSSGDYVAILGSTRVQNGAFFVNVVDENTFTYELHEFEEFTTPGTYTWTAPDGVENVSVVALGGGGGGGQTSDGAGGGAGGGLGWKRRISVSPGEEYAVVVGSGGTRDTDAGTGNNASSGGDSYFISSNIVAGLGGGPAGQVGTGTVYRRGGAGGGFVGDGGGFGGNGGQHNRNDRGGGGGGAGGYEGNGGIGGGDGAGLAGNGGAAGGGGAGSSTLTGGNGGGVGILGIGTSGSGGALGGNGIGGGGGSGGETGRNGTVVPRVAGLYGGGGGGHDNTGQVNADGAGGAIRIIWGGGAQYPDIGTNEVSLDNDTDVVYGEVLKFITPGNIQYTHFLHPEGSLNNTSGPNYQPLISLRLSPSADSGLTGKLGDRDIINRMQVRMQEIGVSTDELVEVKLILNGRLNNLGFTPVDQPSLVELVEHTLQDTVSGGIQIYNFQAEANSTTTQELETLFELSNSILGGDNIFPDGPDILTVAVSRLTGNDTRTSAKLSWLEAQA